LNDSIEKNRGGIAILTGLTGGHGIFHFMQQSFAVMLPAIKETFGISPIEIGALMAAREIAMGVSSLPGGVLSDRLGRYRGIIMAACIALFGRDIMFTVIIGLLGIFLRSDYALLSAAILDIVGQRVATTMLGVLSFLRFIMAAVSPVVAGFLYQAYGMRATLFFTAALFVISAIIFAGADLTQPPEVTENQKKEQ
jgi:MFS family permease